MFPSWKKAIEDITDSRFTKLPQKEFVRVGARIMYDRLYVLLHAEQSPGSILDVAMICPACSCEWRVGDCEQDVDGDGSLGCPECGGVVKEKA